MSNTVAKPRNTLDIKHVRVCDAYFAKRIDEPEHEETQEEYIVKSGDTLSKIAKAKATTVSDLKKDNKLTSDVIQLGQKLTVNTQVEKGNKVTFEQLYNANLGDEVYVVVITSNFENKKVWLNVRQGDEEGLVEANCAVQLLVNDQEVFRPEAVVGAYANDTKITNGADFKDWAIFKFKLGGKDTKAYADALEKLTNKKTKLCIIIDAHNPNSIPSNHVGYEGYDGKLDHSEEPNCWLDSNGKWFELKSNGVVEYSIFYDGKIEKTDVKEPKKAIYNYYDSNNIKHLLGEVEISKTKRHIKKDTLTTKDDYIFLAYAKDIQNYNSDGVKFAFAEWTSSSGRWYINPDCFAGLIGAMIEESIEDLGFNGFSIKNGNTAGGSSSHINGEKGDLRYLSTNLNGERTYLQDSHFDYERQVKFNNALYKFGWGRLGKMYSENFNRTTINKVLNPKTNKIEEKEIVTSTLLPHTKHMKKTEGTPKYRHHHHLHLTGFNHSNIILK